MYGTTRDSAEALLARIPEGFRPSNLRHDCVISRFEVRPHSWLPDTRIPDKWGVYPRWSYADRPDLGQDFGGPFIPLKDIP